MMICPMPCAYCGGKYGEHEGDCPAKFTGIQPTLVSINEEILRSALTAISSGIENTRQCLAEHDSTLGRTIKKNKLWAETLERDIEQMEAAAKRIREAMGWQWKKTATEFAP